MKNVNEIKIKDVDNKKNITNINNIFFLYCEKEKTYYAPTIAIRDKALELILPSQKDLDFSYSIVSYFYDEDIFKNISKIKIKDEFCPIRTFGSFCFYKCQKLSENISFSILTYLVDEEEPPMNNFLDLFNWIINVFYEQICFMLLQTTYQIQPYAFANINLTEINFTFDKNYIKYKNIFPLVIFPNTFEANSNLLKFSFNSYATSHLFSLWTTNPKSIECNLSVNDYSDILTWQNIFPGIYDSFKLFLQLDEGLMINPPTFNDANTAPTLPLSKISTKNFEMAFLSNVVSNNNVNDYLKYLGLTNEQISKVEINVNNFKY